MSANVETLFYVGREKPWHGLGVSVEAAPTSAEAIKLAGLDWEVLSKPVFTESGLQIPGYVANTRDSDNSVLGIVTDKYKVVQNSEAFEFTDSLINDEVHYETAGSLKNGKTVWLLAKMPSTTILGDEVEPYMCFTNSHDGTGAIKVCMTPVRVVCQNTLNFALNSTKRMWSTKHMGNLEEKMHEAKVTLGLAQKYTEELAVTAEQLANQRITMDEINKMLDDMFPVSTEDSDRKKRNVQEVKDNFMICYFAPDIAKFKGTKWGVANAATDFADHTTPTRNTKNYKENNWGKIMNGHVFVDTIFDKLMAQKA